ncbi:transposase [Streptomyces sp. MNU76]|uniref:transposase n=1 Tax=Streptomyces sp. MNU76 TaxID=2560026 RepID=UPI001E61ABFE|nr:transposase [Streptomyces sp. MNU76]MCC9711906.1 transposase [Streptomyces sp. MNU76]
MKKNNHPVEGPDGLVHTARLPLSSATLNWLADLLRGHFKKIGSRWRALPAGKIAGIVLAVLRCDQRPGDLAGGNGIHRTTVTRWVREVVGLLAARAPRLDRALKKIARKGGGVVLLDGSVIRTRRRTGAENRKNYSGKNKCHGLLVIALTDDRGRLLWVSAARPGRTSEITACRHDKLTAHLPARASAEVGDGRARPNFPCTRLRTRWSPVQTTSDIDTRPRRALRALVGNWPAWQKTRIRSRTLLTERRSDPWADSRIRMPVSCSPKPC